VEFGVRLKLGLGLWFGSRLLFKNRAGGLAGTHQGAVEGTTPRGGEPRRTEKIGVQKKFTQKKGPKVAGGNPPPGGPTLKRSLFGSARATLLVR